MLSQEGRDKRTVFKEAEEEHENIVTRWKRNETGVIKRKKRSREGCDKTEKEWISVTKM